MCYKKNDADLELVTLAQSGDEQAVNALIVRHRPFVLRLVKKMAASEAEDITHDIFIKVLTHLEHFRQHSSFTTWLYRITINHVLRHKRDEKLTYADDNIHALEETLQEADACREDVMQDYHLGMLLCLDEDQRLTITLADILRIDYPTASAMLKISEENFRQRLSRARKDLKNWMLGKCSLVSAGNSCQCNRKTQRFVNKGWVDAATMKFSPVRVHQVSKYIRAYAEPAAV